MSRLFIYKYIEMNYIYYYKYTRDKGQFTANIRKLYRYY